ncbi:MAG: hypothetical protein ABR976_06130 [Terracidiphilus sp.]
MFEHLLGDVTGNIHDGLIAGTALGKIGNQRVPVVVPAALHLGILAHIIPCRLKRGDRACRIARTRFPEWENIPLGVGHSELLAIPLTILGEDLQERGIQRDRPPLSRFGLAPAHGQVFLCEVDLSPCQRLDFCVTHSSVERQRQRRKDVRRTGLSGLLQHPVFFIRREGPPDCLTNLELEHLSFAEPDAHQVARIAEDAKEKTHFLIDTLRRCLFAEARILVMDDSCFVEINQHLAAENPLQVIDCIVGKARRLWQAQLVSVEILLRHVTEGANSLLACVGEVIEALFQFAPTLLFRIFCNGLGRAFAGLLNTPSRKPELIPPDTAATEETHASSFIARIRAAVGSAGRSESSLARLTSSCVAHETGACGSSLLGTVDIINLVCFIRTSAMANLSQLAHQDAVPYRLCRDSLGGIFSAAWLSLLPLNQFLHSIAHK